MKSANKVRVEQTKQSQDLLSPNTMKYPNQYSDLPKIYSRMYEMLQTLEKIYNITYNITVVNQYK